MIQDLGSDHLSILQTVLLSLVFRPNERPPSFNFQKARWNDFAFYFDSHCPSAEEYSSLSLSSAAALLTSLTLNALLTIWCSEQTAMFLFLLAKTALAYLPTALPVPLRPLFSFQQAQYAKFFRWSMRHSASSLLVRQHLKVWHFSSLLLLSDSCSVLATLSSPPSFLLPQSLWQEPSSLSSCSLRPQWVHGHLFLPGNNAVNELAWRGALFVPSTIPCSLSPLISRIHSHLFSDWRCTVWSKFFDTQVLSISIEQLVLFCYARCVLSRLRCNGHRLLLSSYQFRIGRLENPSCSACGHSSQDTSHLIIHCPATDTLRCSLFGGSLSLCELWSRPLGVARLLGLDGLRPCPHPSEGVK